MIRHDYIMMMIEQMINVLAKILFNKETKNYQAALSNIDSALLNLSGLDYTLIHSIGDEELISLLNDTGNTGFAKYIIIAKLLKERAEIIKEVNNEDPGAISDYQKSLGLFLESILNDKNQDSELNKYYSDIQGLVEKLKNSDIPHHLRFRLFKYFKLKGIYDKAENELFKLKSIHYNNIESEGIQFYKDLNEISNENLINGNLSREELKQGLDEFIKKES